MLTKIKVIFMVLYVVRAQKPSPCPSVLQYNREPGESDRWYAVITLSSNEPLTGIWLNIMLDRPADSLGIFFNGKSICSSTDRAGEAVTSRVTVAQTRPTSSNVRPTNSNPPRPSRPSSLNNGATTNSRPSSRPTSRPTTSSIYVDNYNQDQNVRPSNNRPSSSNFNNRPSSTSNFYNGNEPTSTNNFRPNNFNNYNPVTDEYDDGIGLSQNTNNFNRPFDNDRGNTNSESGEEFFSGDFASPGIRPLKQPSRPSILGNEQCGRVATQPRPLISHGQHTVPGQWPWHAALYYSKGIQLMYTCGGTLISTKHILTAAHCVTKPRTNRPIKAQDLLIYLGKYNLKKFGSEIQDREVSDINIHPQYNYSVYYNDIAILRLAEPAEITRYVRPVCLWEDIDNLNQIEGTLGTVVGWGFDHNRQLSTTLMQAQMPIVSTATCIYSNRDFYSQFTSENSYCAGFRNGTSVCNGDSGGGMVFPRRGTSDSNTVWQIRGLVSVGVALQGQGLCDPTQYIVFTDVAKYIDWIEEIILHRNP
ncbi:hypothetical protein HHI36_021370 [Cryptolaemus montrouzieri]|uniref:Peptidase S1 domain-containing protein n=1 Tax=Cryptolaemus montrouzieri TaxID=559131 RepID=A0ABD2MXK1_9CUCU